MERVGSVLNKILKRDSVIYNDISPDRIMKDEKIFARCATDPLTEKRRRRAGMELSRIGERVRRKIEEARRTWYEGRKGEEDEGQGPERRREASKEVRSDVMPLKRKISPQTRPVKSWETRQRGKNYSYKRQPAAFLPVMTILFSCNRNKTFQTTAYQPQWIQDKLSRFHGMDVSIRTVQNVLAWAEQQHYIRRVIRKVRTCDGRIRTRATLVLLTRRGKALLGGLAKMVGRALVWYRDLKKRFTWAVRNEACKAHNGRYKDEFLIQASRSGTLEALAVLP